MIHRPGEKTRPNGGFTLLEVLVSIGVFSVVAMVAYATLDTYIDQRERLTGHYGRLERLQRLFILLERDIQYAANRPVRVGGDVAPAISGPEGQVVLSLTVAQADVSSPTGVTLKRVEWRREGKELIRAQWNVLDRPENTRPSELLVSEAVSDLSLNFWFYSDGRGTETRTRLDPEEFPAGIEVSVTLDDGAEFRRLYALAQGG